jgi:hypothetical protein
MTTLAQHRDTRQFWLEDDALQWAKSPDGVPDEVWDTAATIYEAITFVQRLGCGSASQHLIKSKYHETCLAVLRMAVREYGEVFPVLLRGTRSSRPDSEHRILFGTTNPDVASFYGEIREYRNIKGLRTRSLLLSVVTDDYSQQDEEIIFFP